VLRADLDQLLDDIRAVAHRVGGDVSRPPDYHEVITIYDRCRGLLNAVHTLTREGLGEAALILTRPMFTESLMRMEIAAADEPTRLVQLARWSLSSLNDLAGVMYEGQSRGRDETQSLANIEARREQINKYDPASPSTRRRCVTVAARSCASRILRRAAALSGCP
jgi:hypothetical protein